MQKLKKSSFTSITNEHIRSFISLIGENNVLMDDKSKNTYGKDETEDLCFEPEVVLKPKNKDEISKIMSFCYEKNIAITPRGAGTGLSGGALPIYGGVCLSTELLDKIIYIDENNYQACAEPGVITQVFQEKLETKGLFYPPDPASRGSCFLGGNIAENSGGPKAVKYGVVQDYVLNLEVVLPDGNIIWTGANVLKNATGYNLTQLLIGSEGTLGIVTKIVFKIIPKPMQDVLMLVPFHKLEDACRAVKDIFHTGITPSGLELMEKDAILYAMKFIGESPFEVSKETEAQLLIELDGNNIDLLMEECEKIVRVLEKYECDDILFADNTKQKEDLWKLRRSVGEAVKAQSIYKEEDTVVPRAHLPELIKKVKDVGRTYNFRTVCYGHAGDGNLHINILKDDLSEEHWNNEVKKGIIEIFECVAKLNGTISGEHGIGLVQKEFLPIIFNNIQLDLMRNIKKVFDPKSILNPGKIWPET